MSRIGRKPIPIPAGVTVVAKEHVVTVTGPRGALTRTLHPELAVKLEGGVLVVLRPSDAPKHRALHGLSRTLVANMVEGVTKGYEKRLAVVGVGYKAELKPFGIMLTVGLSHTVDVKAPAGIKLTAEATVPAQKVADNHSTTITVSGADKELVGEIAAEIRGIRPPEPYKGKGIRYLTEKVRRKAGKTGTGAK
jgi:large subunit ribosomal protein L6